MLVGNNLQEIQHVKTHLHNSFSIKDLGTLCYFLGFEISRSPSGIVLNKQKYYLDLLSDSGLLACKPANKLTTSLMEPSCPLSESEGSLLLNLGEYRDLLDVCNILLTLGFVSTLWFISSVSLFQIHENFI